MAGNPFAAIGAKLPSTKAPAAPAAGSGATTNPFAAIGAAPGAATQTAPNSEVQSVGTANNKYLGMIGASGNTAAAQQAANVANHNSGGGWFHDVLSALDLPRAVAVSGLDQGLHGWDNYVMHDVFGQKLPANDAPPSMKAFEQGVSNHETTGHILAETGLPHWLDSVGGMAGDVIFDPLSYVGGLGEAAKAMGIAGHVADAVNATSKAAELGDTAEKFRIAAEGAKAAGAAPEDVAALATAHQEAHTAAQAAAEEATAKTGGGILNGDTMARLQTKGVAGLTQEERGVLSNLTGTKIEMGIGLRVPGTKLAGNPTYLKLVPGAITDPVSAAIHDLTSHVADSKVVNGLEQKLVNLGAVKSAIRSASLAGDGTRAAKLTNMMRVLPEASGVARKTLNEFGPQFADALSKVPDAVAQHVPAAMDGDASAAQAITDAGGNVGPLRDAYNGLRSRAAETGVPISSLDDYFPHQLTDAAKEAFGKVGSPTRARRGFEGALQRQYKPGATFLGHTLQTGSIDEINQIAHDVYGKDAFDVFKSDPREITAQYVRGLSRRIGEQHFANRLDDLGVTTSGDPAMTPDDWKALGHSYGLSSAVQAVLKATGPSGVDSVPLASTGAHAGQVAEPYVRDALKKIEEAQASGKPPSGFLKWYDSALSLWKKYQLAMPGKAIRHTVAGPAWGTYLGNVGSKSLREGFSTWRTFQRALKANGDDFEKALQAVPLAARKEIREATEQGIFHGHDFKLSEISGKGRPNWNPLSNHFRYFEKNGEIQARGTDYWRFAMFHDAVKNGALAPEAAKKVRTMLGDPHAITSFERSTARRLIPFYTFLRQNLPVELSNLAKQPGKFVNAYEAPKQEVEQWTPPDAIVPQMFNQTLSVRLPWKIGGSRVYLSPDLPFTRIGQLFGGVNQDAAQMSPLVQDAIAAVDHVNTFTGNPYSPEAKAAPGAWASIPGLMDTLHAIAPGSVMKTVAPSTDYGVTTPAGTWEMTPQAESIIESLVPPLGQARRIYATEPNMQPRAPTTWLSDLLGQNFRVDDPSQQAGELLRRQQILKAMVENEQNQGRLPRYIYGFKPS